MCRGRPKGVRFVVWLKMVIIGSIDGARGLPRAEADAGYLSPHMVKTAYAYAEFNARVWGDLQLEHEETFAALSNLMDVITQDKLRLSTANERLQAALHQEPDRTRHYGEEEITESEVAQRRRREQQKRLVPYRRAVASLEDKLAEAMERFIAQYSEVTEAEHTTALMCERVQKHLGQQISIYWNYVVWRHPKRNQLPAAPPAVTFHNIGEEIYLQHHAAVRAKMDAFRRSLHGDKKTEVTD